MTDKLIQYVKIAQMIEVQTLLGTDLYNKIMGRHRGVRKPAGGFAGLTGNYLTLVTEFIQPTLIWFAQMNYIPFSAYSITNKGILKGSSETAQNVDKDEVDYLVAKAREYANYYMNSISRLFM